MTGIARKRTAPPGDAPPGAPLSIVGVAASPAYLRSVAELLAALPPDGGAAIVVLQDARSGKKGAAARALAKAARIEVVEAKEGERLCANRAYVVPPGSQAWLEHGVLRVAPPDADAPARPVDRFFRSLAEDQEERAIGVVLPRTSDDGSLGLEHVVAHGGLVLAQEDGRGKGELAAASGIDAGLATEVLALRDMPAAIVRRARHPGGAGWDAGALQGVRDILRRRFDVPFEAYRQSMVLRRIERRMGLRRVERPAAYLELLENDPVEANALVKDLLIGVTGFFRDAEAWQALEAEAIRPLVRLKDAGEPIRAWVVGAGTGEEAYSLAMAIADERLRAGRPGPIQVFATDANAQALQVARAGVYAPEIAGQVSPERLARYFIQAQEHGGYRVQRAVREMLVFGTHDVITDPPLSRVDLVSCRNLLIYLELPAQQRIVEAFHFALNAGGYLFLGGGEMPPQEPPMFETLSRRWRIYRRLGGPHREPATGTAPVVSAASLAQTMILERFAPASVLVDERRQVLYYAGSTERYLRPPRGTPTRDLAALVRDGLRTELHDALHRAAASGRATVAHGAIIQPADAMLPVKITVAPLAGSPAHEERKLFLVVFQDRPERAARGGRRARPALVRRLEEDLRGTREELQTTIERLERSNEDLRASEAELMSANEELRAANDELVRWKQEMQSLIDDLQTANDDLRNLLASSDLASVCLDAGLHIKWFSPAARSVLNVISTDAGRPISDLASPLAGESLVADAREVLRVSGVIERELNAGARWYLRRTMPYRTEQGAVQGVIVNFTDVSEARRGSEAALAARVQMTQSLEERVAAATIQVRTLAAALALAEQSEREAIARDLHDNLAQVLHVAKLKLAVLRESHTEASAVGVRDELEVLVNQAEASVRSLVFQIHPPLLSQLGLVPALEWLAEDLQRSHGLAVEMRNDEAEKPLDPAIRAVAYRAVRELLINVAKHAGVHSASVELKRVGDALGITVRDRGRGFAAPSANEKAFGLLSLRERLSYIGGSLQVSSLAGQGTEATLTVPLAAEPRAGAQEAAP